MDADVWANLHGHGTVGIVPGISYTALKNQTPTAELKHFGNTVTGISILLEQDIYEVDTLIYSSLHKSQVCPKHLY